MCVESHYPPRMRRRLFPYVLTIVTVIFAGTSALLHLRSIGSHTFSVILLVASAALFLTALVGLLKACWTVR